tara:strand:+ start:423 stop:896 length:474 start_codon:yes stop_codon:yes gene_type:complete
MEKQRVIHAAEQRREERRRTLQRTWARVFLKVFEKSETDAENGKYHEPNGLIRGFLYKYPGLIPLITNQLLRYCIVPVVYCDTANCRLRGSAGGGRSGLNLCGIHWREWQIKNCFLFDNHVNNHEEWTDEMWEYRHMEVCSYPCRCCDDYHELEPRG